MENLPKRTIRVKTKPTRAVTIFECPLCVLQISYQLYFRTMVDCAVSENCPNSRNMNVMDNKGDEAASNTAPLSTPLKRKAELSPAFCANAQQNSSPKLRRIEEDSIVTLTHVPTEKVGLTVKNLDSRIKSIFLDPRVLPLVGTKETSSLHPLSL